MLLSKFGRRNARRHMRLVQRRAARPFLEQLEARNLLSAYPLTPGAIRTAYGYDLLPATITGLGQTIAIIDAYDAPNIAKDLDLFDQTYSWTTGGPSLYTQFGSSASFFTKATQTTHISANVGWAQEISLDVQWAHAIAPAAKIMLVEAKSNSISDLLIAVDYASTHGATVVSMSWGAGEFSGESAYDSHFNHAGVTYVASSGDVGGVTQWPAVSPYVVSVGGTALQVDASGNYVSESAWTGSGGGISAFVSKPSYQSTVTISSTMRTTPDLAYNADPNTGFAVYDSYFAGGWGQYGGTSAGAPQIAGMIALANQLRGVSGSSADTLQALYNLGSGSTNFRDVTSGNTSSTISAAPGYDLATGLGTPSANNLVTALAAATVTPVTGGGSGGTGTGGGRPGRPHTTSLASNANNLVFITSFPPATPLVVQTPAPAQVVLSTPAVPVLPPATVETSINRRVYFHLSEEPADQVQDDNPDQVGNMVSAGHRTQMLQTSRIMPSAVPVSGNHLPAIDAAFSQAPEAPQYVPAALAIPEEPQEDEQTPADLLTMASLAMLVGTGMFTRQYLNDEERRDSKPLPN